MEPVCPKCKEPTPVKVLISTEKGVAYKCPAHGINGILWSTMTDDERAALQVEERQLVRE